MTNDDVNKKRVAKESYTTVWYSLSERRSTNVFLGIAVLLFGICAAITITRSLAMRYMPEMSMPGGWTMSMTWMIMPGQNWLSAALSFLNMWLIMMVPMMMPVLLPMLLRYCHRADKTGLWFNWPVVLAAPGYFFIWALCGMSIFCLGLILATIEMRSSTVSHLVPIIASGVIILAGGCQFTKWKAQQLVCCKKIIYANGRAIAPFDAIKRGLRLGFYCCGCCLNLTLILLVIGVMDLKAMAAITIAMTAERFCSNNKAIVYGIGVAAIATGTLSFINAVGLK